MTKLNLLFSIAAFTLTVTTASAEPALSPHTLAEAVTYGGMPGPQGAMPARGMRILKDGQVIKFSSTVIASVAQISSDRVKALQTAIDAIKETPLEANDPDAPECQDAPETLYRIVKSNGETVKIVMVKNCKKYRLANHADREIKHIVQGLEALSQLH